MHSCIQNLVEHLSIASTTVKEFVKRIQWLVSLPFPWHTLCFLLLFLSLSFYNEYIWIWRVRFDSRTARRFCIVGWHSSPTWSPLHFLSSFPPANFHLLQVLWSFAEPETSSLSAASSSTFLSSFRWSVDFLFSISLNSKLETNGIYIAVYQ